MTNVRFDDRLATLLTLPLAGARDRAVRWRQLVELAARAGREDEHGAPFIAAVAVVQADAPRIARDVRAATARAIAGRGVPLPLLELFAADELAVAAPILAGIRLTQAQFDRLIAIADPDVRAFLVTLHPDLAGEADNAGLSDIVARLKSPRTEAEPANEAHAVEALAPTHDETAADADVAEPAPEPASAPDRVDEFEHAAPEPLFQWESDASGEIGWVEGVPRGALIGFTLANPEDAGEIAARFARRSDFAALPLLVEPLGAHYLVSGTPAFDPSTGRFLGYRGQAWASPSDAEEHGLPRPPEADDRERPAATTRSVESVRELVHEIKTPLNAIIGFAEIIDGQFLGPAHRGYRERAAEIVAQARILLGAIEDLDFAAREQAQRAQSEMIAQDADVGRVLDKLIEGLRPAAQRRGVRIAVDLASGDHHCRLDAGLAERLLRRLFGALLETLGEGETLFIEGARAGSHCELSIARPRALADLSSTRLLDPALSLSGDQGTALLGLGFSLRLVRGLIRIAGGELTIDRDRIRLHLPAVKP